MKKYALILSLLVLIGLALTTRFFTQETQLDNEVFIETTKSIRNLQSLDKNLLLLIYQSRYNSEFDNDELIQTHERISEEFDNLRYEALFSEIENSVKINNAIMKFDDHFRSRQETLQNYIQNNMAISESLINISLLTYQLSDESDNNIAIAAQSVNLQALIAKINALIYDFVIGENLQETALKSDRNKLVELSTQIEFNNSKKASQLLGIFIQDIDTVLNNFEPAQQQFIQLNSLNSSQLLDAIEDQYSNYHNEAITFSKQFRTALLAYGLCLLVALLFFAWQIRKNYLHLGQQVSDRTKEIKLAYDDLQESQEQLIQSEKMASLGQMVAGVAHEINTPLGYVTSNVEILKVNFKDVQSIINMLGETSDEIRKENRNNKLISQKINKMVNTYVQMEADIVADESVQLLNDGSYGLAEISKLVSSLKDFARIDRQSTEQIDIHTCLDNSVTIASNHIKDNDIKVIKEYSDLAKISCFPSKVNQLFLNIITNACQAMKDTGDTLTISTHKSGDNIMIQFQDQGCGMDENTQQKMFDPFFTSKDIGDGTGLGMSIAYKIIEAHNGKINVESEVGKGTTIDVLLPYQK